MYEERLYPFCIALFLLCFDLFLSKCRMKASDFSEFGSHSSMQAGQILGNAGYTPVLMNFANESFGKMAAGCLFFALAVHLAWTTAYTTLHRSSQGMFKKCPKYAHISLPWNTFVFSFCMYSKKGISACQSQTLQRCDAGGGWLSGMWGAQEEGLMRRSSLYLSLWPLRRPGDELWRRSPPNRGRVFHRENNVRWHDDSTAKFSWKYERHMFFRQWQGFFFETCSLLTYGVEITDQDVDPHTKTCHVSPLSFEHVT